MSDSQISKSWLQSDLGTVLLAQVGGDPGLPHPVPTTSSWQLPQDIDVAEIQSPCLPSKTDFLVIGSGVAGCGATKALLENSLSKSCSVTVLEARKLCSGATGRNGGQLVRPYPLRHGSLVEQFGVEQATKIARLAISTLEEMHALAASFDPELEVAAKARRLTKTIAYMDLASWEKARAALHLYEEHLPEEVGIFKSLSAEDLSSVSMMIQWSCHWKIFWLIRT